MMQFTDELQAPFDSDVNDTTFHHRELGLFSFTDEGHEGSKQLAGGFFQASLLPYLIFLYLLAYRGNRIPFVGNFGFQYLLLFVAMTIAAGIVAKASYGYSLADVDWLHGLSESLLTVSNLLIVFGFNEAMAKPDPPSNMGCYMAVIYSAICFVFVALGTTVFAYEEHSQLLGGFGNIPSDWTAHLPWKRHDEPVNALSIPTWMVHFSSVFEYLFAMNLIWRYSNTSSGNSTFKGLTWAMLPLHGSSICAVTHHFFYNASELLFLVTVQAFLTLLGNVTCMIAAFRIARSNGWAIAELVTCNCGRSESTDAPDECCEPLRLDGNGSSSTRLAFKLLVLVTVSSFLVKYGELGWDLPVNPNTTVALILIIGVPAISALQYSILSLPRFDTDSGTHAKETCKDTRNGLPVLEEGRCDEETLLLLRKS